MVYASGIAGIAGPSPEELADDLEPLFDLIVREVAPPTVQVRVVAYVGVVAWIHAPSTPAATQFMLIMPLASKKNAPA